MVKQSLPFGEKGWDYNRVPDLTGKIFAVTGGNSGIGFETAKMLVSKNAHVTIFCRSEKRAAKAVREISEFRAPKAQIEFELMDLSDLESVREVGERFAGWHQKLDGLINNAGIMMIPKREETKDGFEMHMGVNHFGHFLFSSILFPLIEEAKGRIVSVSSVAHKWAKEGMSFDDLQSAHHYSPMVAYGQSKLANMLFARELNRRLEFSHKDARAYLCHPGYAATNLQRTGPSLLVRVGLEVMNALVAHSAFHGAKSQVLAATEPEAQPNVFYGPTRLGGLSGPVGISPVHMTGEDDAAAEKLWEKSVELTGAQWPLKRPT